MSSSYDKKALRKHSTDLWVGLFVFMGMAIMGALIIQFGRFSDRLRETYYLYITFTDAGGIIRGSPVKLGGAVVGFVTDDPVLNQEFTGVTVPLEIHQEKQIPLGSRFTIAASGLMGDSYIRIQSPDEPTGKYIPPDTQIKGFSSAGLDIIQEKAGELSKQANLVMSDVRDAIVDIRAAVKNLDKAAVKIDQGLLSDENVDNFKDTLADLKKTGENFKTASAKLEPLLDSGKEAAEEAKTAMGKAGETLDTAKEVIKKAEPAMEKLDPTITELKETLAKANAAIDKITTGDGTAAALISDSELKENLESFIANLNEHGILGYRNDSKEEETGEETSSQGKSRNLFKKLFSGKR